MATEHVEPVDALHFARGMIRPRFANKYRVGYMARGAPYDPDTSSFLLDDDDGVQTWAVFENKRTGKKEWQLQQHANERYYFTHDNGGRPFMVRVIEKNPKTDDASVTYVVKVYTVPPAMGDKEPRECREHYSKLAHTFKNVEMVWVGQDTGNLTEFDGVPRQFNDGNSVLLTLNTRTRHYALIGESVVEFTTDQPIERFESYVGNNDVPYPCAYTRSHVLFFPERVQVRRTALPVSSRGVDPVDVYDQLAAAAPFKHNTLIERR